MEMDTLQKLIEKRAEVRLDADINQLKQAILNCRLTARPSQEHNIPWDRQALQNSRDGAYPYVQAQGGNQGATWETKPLYHVFNGHTSYLEKLKACWLPIYIQEESEAFLKEFDQLKAQFGSLQEQVDNLPQQY